MSNDDTYTIPDSYDTDRPLKLRCACGADHTPQDHGSATPVTPPLSTEQISCKFIEESLVNALFPHKPVRRAFLKAVGHKTAMAAIASVLPVASLQAMAQERRAPEKRDLKVGFIPITCASPLIVADPLGFYRQQGLNVQLVRTAGWALIRDKMLNREHDASHFLAPMPLAISLGLGSTQVPMRVATIQNINGQAIVLANQHRGNRDPRNWRGFRFAIPFEHSIHNYLLRYYLAEHGLNPVTDVQLRVTPPPEMVANLRAGNIDGFLGPDPFSQRAVFEGFGFIHLLSRELWDGHPCCAFGMSEAFIRENPNTYVALFRSVLTAAAMAREARNRQLIARLIAPRQYLNQPEEVLMQVLTGRFADGLGNVRNVPERVDFDPMPWPSMAIWMMTQMQRWGYLDRQVNYRQIAEQVFLMTDARRFMRELGQPVPEGGALRRFTVMGREFDPARPAEYLRSFPIHRMATTVAEGVR